jgi:hypothetical protein
VFTGASGIDAATEYEWMVFGQLLLGNTPTSWSGKPFEATERVVAVHVHATVLVALTDALELRPLYE